MDMILKTTDLCKKIQKTNSSRQCEHPHFKELCLRAVGTKRIRKVHNLEDDYGYSASNVRQD